MKFNRINDLYFKQLMGDPHRKNLTLNFLNSILIDDDDKDHFFTDLNFDDKDIEPNLIDGKLSKLDIKATLNDGSIVDIEVQVCPYELMAERSLYYWARMYADELDKGEEYKLLKKAITINLLNFNHLKEEPGWHNIYKVLNVKSHNLLTTHLEMHFLELPKFTFKDIRKLRESEKWMMYFSGDYTAKDMEVLAMNSPAIKEALDFEKAFNQDKQSRREYELREKAVKDYYSFLSAEREAGEKRGEKRGIAIGRKQGIIDTAKNLLRAGASIELVTMGTGLTRDEVIQLKNDMK